MTQPAVVECPAQIYRVARTQRLIDFSRIRPADADLPTSGNRFDVPGGGVLYAASQKVACFAETLSRYRPTPVVRAAVGQLDPGFMLTGGVPRDWRLQRSLATISLDRPLPFLDLEHPDTHAFVNSEMAGELVTLGYADNLDASDVLNRDRRLSRAIARLAYTATNDDGDPQYSGIKYGSRLDTDWECWAVFDGTVARVEAQDSIEREMPEIEEICARWDITVH